MRAKCNLCAGNQAYARSEKFMREEPGLCAFKAIYAREPGLCALKAIYARGTRLMRAQSNLCAGNQAYTRSVQFMLGEPGLSALSAIYVRRTRLMHAQTYIFAPHHVIAPSLFFPFNTHLY